jgi:predicted dehydrogenase
MNILVVGKGSAGERHIEILTESMDYGDDIAVFSCDPDKSKDATYGSMGDAIRNEKFDVVVIATPPALHLQQIEIALDHDAWVMCEKPLCAIGQMEHALELYKHENIERVAFAYNYHFHPKIAEYRKRGFVDAVSDKWTLECEQYRPKIPGWGLILDHISHDLDILRFLSLQELYIQYAEVNHFAGGESYFIEGKLGTRPFEIRETVHTKKKVDRKAIIRTPYGQEISLDRSDKMYVDMWEMFFERMGEGLEQYGWLNAKFIQMSLEDVYAKIYGG